jgi:hypothetical protein
MSQVLCANCNQNVEIDGVLEAPCPCCGQMLSMKPETIETLMAQGYSFLSIMDWSRAYQTFMRCRELKPNSIAAIIGVVRAISRDKAGDISAKALQEIKDCLSEICQINNGVVDEEWVQYIHSQHAALERRRDEIQGKYNRAVAEHRVAAQRKAEQQEAQVSSHKAWASLAVTIALLCIFPGFFWHWGCFVGTAVFFVVALVAWLTKPNSSAAELSADELAKFTSREQSCVDAANAWGVPIKENHHVEFPS